MPVSLAKDPDDGARQSGKREAAYVSIERHLWQLLADGGGVEAPLPGEIELAQRFGVSVMTVRQAYTQLVNAGAVYRVRSKGTFATPRLTDELDHMTGHGYPDAWRTQSPDVSGEVLDFGLRVPPAHIAVRFGLAEDSGLTYLERRRRVRGVPVAWDTRWLLPQVADESTAADFARTSVFGVMEEIGLRVVTMRSDIGAAICTKEYARTLECGVGEPLLTRELWCANPAGSTVITGTSLYPSSRFSFRSTTPLTELHFEDPPHTRP
ncbi:MAG: UTRA domain-containing protein [Streptosporangiales bacterium]|nr:UTRA domain-containing protein [Streptosporangiales bacterium]